MSVNHVTVHCKVCDKPIEVAVDLNKLAGQVGGILRVMLAHGDPMHAILVYVDKNLRVRSIEYPDSVQVGETQSTAVVQAADIAESLSDSMGESCYQSMCKYEEVKEREATSFILDKTILKVVCDSGTICLSEIRRKVAFLEKAMGSRINLAQIEAVCERYVKEGLIKRA